MKAYIYEKPGVAKLVDKEKPVVTESTDAIIRMVKTTICGTDLHEYLEGPVFISTDKPDPFLGQKAPVTLGHEFSGIVEEVGKDVTKYKKGDRVVYKEYTTTELIVNNKEYIILKEEDILATLVD